MSYTKTTYIAKAVNKNGIAEYTPEENLIWSQLISEQHAVIQGKACREYLDGLKILNLPTDRIPQCVEISDVLQEITGWSLEPVPALISFDRFFSLLANRRFPAATFIRTMEELHYLKEPDIFHEIVGHCPLLTHAAYAEFVQKYGQIGLNATAEERVLLARLFWFTIEFGLINTPEGLRAYGGGILSSINETIYALESPIPVRKSFDMIETLQTPYQIDVIQPIYFVLDQFDQLYHLIESDLISIIHRIHHLTNIIPKHAC